MEIPNHLVQGVVKPHLEDSMAPAEHLNSFDVEQQLRRLGPCKTPSSFLTRAWIYNEYALATVETDDDDRCFRMGREDLMQVIDNDSLGPRHPLRLSAAMLLAYEPAFRARANSEDVSHEMRDDLQASLVAFAELDTTPDYASNAQALREAIIAREAHAKAAQAAIKAGTAVDDLYE